MNENVNLCEILKDKDEESESFVSNKCGAVICRWYEFGGLGLNIEDYKDLKWEDEPVEVFLNLGD